MYCRIEVKSLKVAGLMKYGLRGQHAKFALTSRDNPLIALFRNSIILLDHFISHKLSRRGLKIKFSHIMFNLKDFQFNYRQKKCLMKSEVVRFDLVYYEHCLYILFECSISDTLKNKGIYSFPSMT